MSNFERAVIKALKETDNAIAQGRREGKAEGINIGKAEGIIQIVKEMLKNKMNDDDIIKYTHISKKELEKLKLQMT